MNTNTTILAEDKTIRLGAEDIAHLAAGKPIIFNTLGQKIVLKPVD